MRAFWFGLPAGLRAALQMIGIILAVLLGGALVIAYIKTVAVIVVCLVVLAIALACLVWACSGIFNWWRGIVHDIEYKDMKRRERKQGR
ncbi:hypothetical protein vBCbaSRXM_40 [Citromicrobium phage vB_CbaS-RXM]|nr:hypothetical protein vBCbaSRXM_40 [Citromicrobium phage vB_CbaS-RXM]